MLRAVLASLANMSAPLLYVDAQDKLQALSRRARELLAGCRDDKGSAGRQLRLCLNEDQGHGPQPQTGGRKVSRTDVSPERLLPEMARPECSMEFSDIIGSTPQIMRSIRFAKQAALTDFAIVLNGESGSGKDVFAQAIHNTSPRRKGPFVALNCGAIAADLVESELFGYEEGAFTGADRSGKIGMLEKASGGTLFLDEVESMPLAVQSKLLRVLSGGSLHRVGSTAEIPVDLRVISASKVDLRKAAERGEFREDLFYRISVVSLPIPPLRDRKEDVPLLARNFLDRIGRRSTAVSPEAMAALCAYNWPGNVRELENVLLHACVFSAKGVITMDSLPEELQSIGRVANLRRFLREQGLLTEDGAAPMARIEAELIRSALEQNHFILLHTARMLHIDRKTLCRKIRQNPWLKELADKGAAENS